jgi:hypothetical protein
MKRKLLPLIVFVMAISMNVQAGSADLFSYDKNAVTSELAELTELENYVWMNPASTLSVLVETGNDLVSGLKLYGPGSMGMTFDDPPLGIPSFLWGCAFGVVGIAIVYFVTDEDNDETKKAFYGCLAGTLVYGVLYAVWWSAWWGTAAWI